MKGEALPRGGLSVAALAVALLVPLSVGWLAEHLAYDQACVTDAVVAPLHSTAPRPAAAVRLAGAEPQDLVPATDSEPKSELSEATPEEPLAAAGTSN
jgi:hypothetical protein